MYNWIYLFNMILDFFNVFNTNTFIRNNTITNLIEHTFNLWDLIIHISPINSLPSLSTMNKIKNKCNSP